MSTTEKIQMKLSDSKSARWTALFIVSVTMMFGYFFYRCNVSTGATLDSCQGG